MQASKTPLVPIARFPVYSRGVENMLPQYHDTLIFGHFKYLEMKQLAGNQ